MRRKWTTWILIAALMAIGCSEFNGDLTPPTTPWTNPNNPIEPVPPKTVIEVKSYGLSAVNDCQDVLKALHDREIDLMQKQLQKQMDYQLKYCEKEPVYDYDRYGDGGPMMASVQNSAAPAPGTTSATTPSDPSTSKTATEYSTTNNQVANVDEADFIKNDGTYIYILADGVFQILQAYPAEEAKILSQFKIEGIPTKLFVHNGRAVIYSSMDPNGNDAKTGMPGAYYQPRECTYGYDCDFTGDGKYLKVTVLDLTDVNKPTLLRETRFSGSYINSRRINNAVYTVVYFPPKNNIVGTYRSVAPSYVGDGEYYYGGCTLGYGKTEAEVTEAFNKKFNDFKAKIEATTLADWLPSIVDMRHDGETAVKETGLLDSCKNFYTNGEGKGQGILTLVSFDLSKNVSAHISSVVGQAGAVYASEKALYIASRQNYSYDGSWYFGEQSNVTEATTLHKFALKSDPVSTEYLVSGVVKGRILNQFSMDEYKDDLRIATSNGHVPNPNVYSTVSVLQQTADGKLTLVGQVDNIAPKEDIRSVRFDGPRGFIVTFKKTDPLFVLDLSVPRAPVIKGELKIPGFSTYMHMLGENHLLTIGYDASDQGSFAWFQGILLQIFDVTDMTKPTLLHKEVIGTRGSTSDAATNHLAFNYFAPKGLLAIPMNICESDYNYGNGHYGDKMTFAGLLVYDVSTESGFKLHGKIDHQDDSVEETQPYPQYNASCNNWWTNSNSTVKRSIFMDDYVYSVAPTLIKIRNLNSMTVDIKSISLKLPTTTPAP